MDYNTILVILASICFIFLFGSIFVKPMKLIIKLVINSLFGGVLIFVINYIGQLYNFHIGLNIINSILVGILGIPGVLLLFIMKI